MTRDETIAELRRRIGMDLAWTHSTDAELADMLAELDANSADDRFVTWEPALDARARH